MGLRAIAVIEVGTTRVFGVLAVPSPASPTGVEIVRVAPELKSAGIRKGEVSNIDAAVPVVKRVLNELGKYPNLTLHDVCAVYNGGALESKEIFGTHPIEADEDGDRIVSEADVDAAMKTMTQERAPSERHILEQFKTEYILDGTRNVDEPCNATAREITVKGLRTHADANGIVTLRRMIEEHCGYQVERVFSAAYGAQLGCLSPEQRELGALVIDLGGGTTSWSVVNHGTVINAGSIPVGGDHITQDLLYAFNTGSEECAQELKHHHASAVLEGIPSNERVELPKNIGIKRSVNLKAISQVVNARMDEIFQIIHEKTDNGRFLNQLGFGVVLCGGGSALRGVDTLATLRFNKPCVIGSPAAAGFTDWTPAAAPNAKEPPPVFEFGPRHSAALGVLTLVPKSRAAEENGRNKSVWDKFKHALGLGGYGR